MTAWTVFARTPAQPRALLAGLAACTALLVSALPTGPLAAGEVGFARISVPDPPGEPLQAGLWYPTRATPSDQTLGLFVQSVAPDAVVDGAGHPLVVISHGTGGSFESHYDTALALAQAGFVVAAMTHTGDNYRDQSRATERGERSRAVHAMIGFMLGAWPEHTAIDPEKVGVFGFSSGGLTALDAIGGVPDYGTIGPYCASHAATYVCTLVKAHPPSPSQAAETADPRIKAAVVAAPAIGFAFAPDGLRAVHVPVQLWRAGDDHILPSPDYAEPVRDTLPRPPEYHVVEGADHFDFLAPCSEDLAHFVPEICQERGGFDRAAFHRVFNGEIVRFFEDTLR